MKTLVDAVLTTLRIHLALLGLPWRGLEAREVAVLENSGGTQVLEPPADPPYRTAILITWPEGRDTRDEERERC